MILKTPEMKNIVFQIISMESTVNKDGARVERITYPKKYFRGAMEIRDKIKDQTEIGVVEIGAEDITTTDIVWISTKDYQPGKERVVGERHKNVGIELSDKALEALKYFYKECEELPAIHIDTLDELEAALKD